MGHTGDSIMWLVLSYECVGASGSRGGAWYCSKLALFLYKAMSSHHHIQTHLHLDWKIVDSRVKSQLNNHIQLLYGSWYVKIFSFLHKNNTFSKKIMRCIWYLNNIFSCRNKKNISSFWLKKVLYLELWFCLIFLQPFIWSLRALWLIPGGLTTQANVFLEK